MSFILSLGSSKNECMEMFYIQIKAVEERIARLARIRGKLRDKIGVFLNEGLSGDVTKYICCEDEMSDTTSELERPTGSWDFDEMASNYIDRFLKADKSYKAGIEGLRKLLQNILPRKSVIDVGCGTCNLWTPLRRFFEKKDDKAASLTAMDKSLPMLMAARENINFGKMRCDDILDYDLDYRETYDIVLSSFMLHHIDRSIHKLAIENMLKLCRDDGSVIIVDKSYDNEATLRRARSELCRRGDDAALQVFDTECPLLKNEFISYVRYLGYKADIKMLTDEVAIYTIAKGKPR
jgi:SAM-dependent methyltransferase